MMVWNDSQLDDMLECFTMTVGNDAMRKNTCKHVMTP